MPIKDLRDWIALMESSGEVRTVCGADCDVELGVIVDQYQRRMELPALLFDEIKGYPKGFRVLANTLTSARRIALTLGLPAESSKMELVQAWRRFARQNPKIPPRRVSDGPINENIRRGKEVDLTIFPAPKWHPDDGNRYIGTGCLVIQKDPDTDWVNVGVYRVAVHDRQTAGIFISPGKHGRLIMEKYWARGQDCPVVVSVGQDPTLFFVAGIEIPYGVSEFEVAGGLRGEAVQVIQSEWSGLPLPATAEIVIEGRIPRDEMREEGPFGEWLGYYASGRKPSSVIKIDTIRYRNNPIIMGNLPALPPNDDTYYRGFLRSAAVWDQLEQSGIPGIKAVWAHEAGGSRMLLIIAIQQMYPGHSKQVGLSAAQCHAGAYANRITIVVDDDIDVTNDHEVWWALCSRMDPTVDIEILKRCWSTSLDPMAYPREKPVFNNRMIIDACRPWERLATFPKVVEAGPELKQKIIEKWREVLPEITD